MNTGSVLAQFTITLTKAVSEPVSVEWFTSDGSAKAGVDYAANKGVALFAPGETEKKVDILVYGRAVGSEDRSFFVEMLPPTNAILGAAIGECIIHVDTSGSQPVTQIIVPTGPKGDEGKSSYQSWLDQGHTGSEADFLEWLKPSPEEIAQEVAPLLDVGDTVLTAEGTESLGKPDKTTVKALARRVAYAGPVKIATVTLSDGDNLVGSGDLSGDAVNLSATSLYPRILRNEAFISPVWSVQPDGKLLVKNATAGDVLYVCDYDLSSGKKAKTNDRELWRRELSDVGLNLVDGSFEDGATVQSAKDVVWHKAGAQCYTWLGALPKVVAAGSNPINSGGISDTAWKDASNSVLGKLLASTQGAGLVGFDPASNYTDGTIGAILKKSPSGVSPELFGGDIQAAANAAVALGLPLITGRKDYEVQNAFTLPSGLTWISGGTRIKMMRAGTGGTNPQDSAIVPQSNTRIIGRVYVYLVDSPGAAAFRAHVLLGHWTTGAGVNDFTFDEFILEGGHNNINGVAIAGDSYNIRGNRIDAGTSTVIGRALMTHWGNFAQHYLSGGKYQHAAGAGPTTHPHDIHIKEVVGNLTSSIGDFMALVGLSAGYDTSVDRIAGSVINNGAGTAQLLLLTGGDMGMAYATPEQRSAGMRNLVFGTVEGVTNKIGISRIGRALYYNADTTPQAPENYYVKISETIQNVNLKSTSNNTIHQAIGGSNYGGKCCYGSVLTDGFVNSFSPGNYDTGGVIDLLVSINNQYNAVLYAGSGGDSSIYPTGMRINKLVINGTGAQGAEALNYHGVRTQSCSGLYIGSLDAEALHPIGYAALFNSLSAGVYIDAIKVPPAYNRGAAVLNQVSAPTDCNVGQVFGVDPLTPISGGITYKPFGRFREFQYPAANSLPIGVNVVVGDRFVATSGTAGQAALSVITGAGVTGSGATAKTLLTF